MNTKKLLVGLMFVLAVAVVAPAVAYMSDAPGTIVDPKSFVIDSFKSALLSDEPGTVVDPAAFVVDTIIV